MARTRPTRLTASLAVALVAVLTAHGLPGSIDPAVAASASATLIVRFDGVKYAASACPMVTVELASPSDPVPDPQLQVGAIGTGDTEMLPLAQSAPDTWTASVCAKPGPSNIGDGFLQVNPGDHVMAATFTGGAPSGMDMATIAGGGSGSGAVNVMLNPQPLPPHMRTIANPLFASGLGPATLKNAGITQPDGTKVYFSEDQVLVRDSAPGDLGAFLARHPKSIVLNSLTLPNNDIEGPAPVGTNTTYYDVYVDASKYSAADAPAQLEVAGAAGTFIFTSKKAMRLYAMIIDEQAGGTQVFPNTIALRDSVPSTDEAQTSPDRVDLFDSSNNPWFEGDSTLAQRVGAPQTMAMLDVMKQDQQPHVKVAVIDGGFAGPNDYGSGITPPDYGAPNGDFNQIPQCSSNIIGILSCGPGAAAGKNPLPCGGSFGACPWHGTQMAATVAGRVANGGPATDGGTSGGIGGDTADLMLYKADWSYFLPLASSINSATASGAKVINLSSEFPCIQFIDLCDSSARTWAKIGLSLASAFGSVFLGIACAIVLTLLDLFANVSLLELAVMNAIAAGVVVVASAGNSTKDVVSTKVVPCIWPGVLCVGALQLDTTNNDLVSAGFSNYGSRLDLWAPGYDDGGFPTPKPQSANNGTSPAAAFVSGVASMVRSIAPNLSGTQVRLLLADAVCRTGHTARVNGANCTPSGNARVDANGYLDVLDALHRARAAAGLTSLTRCSAGWDQLTNPNDDPRSPRDIPGSPFQYTQFGLLGTWTGDATVKRSSFTPNGQPDGQWYRLSFDPTTIPPNAPASDNVRIQLHVPDPSLGALTMEVWAVTQPGYGQVPPTLKLDNPYNLIDTTTGGGTGEWDGYIIVTKTYYVHVIATAPEAQNNNCFDSLSITAIRGGGNPPPREAGLELGFAEAIGGLQLPQISGVTNTMLVPVTLSQPLPYDVTFHYQTYDGTAKAGVDYSAMSGTLTIPSGQTSTQIPVPILAKSTGGYFGVFLTNANAPLYHANTVVGIDKPATKGPSPIAEVSGTGVYEGDVGAPRAIAIVQLDRPATTNTVFQYTLTSTDSIILLDWNGSGGNISIPKGQTQAVIHFSILGDTQPENTEHVTVTLTGISIGNATIGPRSSADVVILDDDDF